MSPLSREELFNLSSEEVGILMIDTLHGLKWSEHQERFYSEDGTLYAVGDLPDYPNDLNACYSVLSSYQWFRISKNSHRNSLTFCEVREYPSDYKKSGKYISCVAKNKYVEIAICFSILMIRNNLGVLEGAN